VDVFTGTDDMDVFVRWHGEVSEVVV
jgi:hypothetical protein